MNKKAVGAGTWGPLIILIGALIAFSILVLIQLGILKFSKETLDQSACSLSARANCYGKYVTFGVETFSLKCPTQFKTITMSDLKAEKKAAKKKMRALATQFPEYIGKNKYVTKDPNDDLAYEFVMNKIIAKDMKDCWGRFKDIPCLFSRWFLPWGKDCTDSKKPEDCKGLWAKLQAEIPPTYCVICTRYKFDDEIQKKFNKTILLGEWLAVNEVPPATGITYAEYLKNDAHPFPSISFNYRTDEPHAVVFGVVKSFFLLHGAGIILEILGEKIKGTEDQKALTLIPFNSVAKQCVYSEG